MVLVYLPLVIYPLPLLLVCILIPYLEVYNHEIMRFKAFDNALLVVYIISIWDTTTKFVPAMAIFLAAWYSVFVQ